MNLVEMHILQSFPVTCLNRDDVGAPKTATFGGCQRARVSSQCWKRAVRSMASEIQPAMFGGKRTRFVVRALEEIFSARELPQDTAKLLSIATADALGKLDDPEKGNVKTLLYFSRGELAGVADAMLEQDYAAPLAAAQPSGDDQKPDKKQEAAQKELAKIADKAVKSLKTKVKDAADIAIFGRMVADDHSLMLEGAGLFSHAISTHAVANEIDFFSAVDDLKPEASEGAGHIGTLEFNSACYYRYVGINVDMLRDDAHLAHFSPEERAAVLAAFLRSAILAVPSARKNSMFGFNPPAHVLGFRRAGQPMSLVNAFEKPVRGQRGHVEESVKAMNEHWDKLARTYCLNEGVAAQSVIPDTDIDTFVATMTAGA